MCQLPANVVEVADDDISDILPPDAQRKNSRRCCFGIWMWDAASIIRGPVDAPKFKDQILPLIFLKRLSSSFNDEVVCLASQAVR